MTNDESKREAPHPKPAAEAAATDHFAADLRAFGPIGIVAILVIYFSGNIFLANVLVPLGAVLVLLWRQWSHTPWRAIGYVWPHSWVGSVAVGLVFGIAFKLVMKALVMPLLDAPAINESYQYLVGNSAALPAAVWSMTVVGFAEETVYRGFLFERFGKLFGNRWWTKIATVLLTTVMFAFGHYFNLGPTGVEQAIFTGLVFGAIYAATTGRIFMLMVAHSAFDLTSIAIIYCNKESYVAHLIFK